MGLLDDMVKLQFGAPAREALWGIGAGIKERKAGEILTPVISHLAEEYKNPANIPMMKSNTGEDVVDTQAVQNRIASMVAKSGGVLGPELLGTETYKSMLGNVQSVSDLILKGVAGKTAVEKGLSEAQQQRAQAVMQRAQAGDIQAQEVERRKMTASLDTLLPNAPFIPKEYRGKPLRDVLSISRAEEPYIGWEEAKLRFSAAEREQKKYLTEFKMQYLMPALGYDITNLGTSIDKDLEDNNIDAIVKKIQKSGGTKETYEQIRTKVEKAFTEYNVSARAKDMYQMMASYAQGEEAYARYVEAMSGASQTPLPKDIFLKGYFEAAGLKAPKSEAAIFWDDWLSKNSGTPPPAAPKEESGRWNWLIPYLPKSFRPTEKK